ncbi:MAG: PEP-CTERM sorting domain-containing protein [Fimbriimonadaceae bacterium]|nr:MAG: PEP-CTERM sorting domain-containing protein [Fimbriimonadaceae bacterium]
MSVGTFAFVNPGFETGDLTGWNISFTPNGRTAIQDVIRYDIDGPGPKGESLAGRFAVGQVNFQAGVQEGMFLTQNLNLTGGTNYVIGYDWSAYRDPGTGDNSQGGVFSVVINGSLFGTQAAGSTGPNTPKYGSILVNFTPTTSGVYTIGASITRPFTVPTGLYQVVDNFSVVPEPGTLLALGAGLAALIARRRAK